MGRFLAVYGLGTTNGCRVVSYARFNSRRTGDDRLIATCWMATLREVVDQADSFALSNSDGATWVSTGVFGQTMTPIPLRGNRLLILYNRRHGS